MAATAGFGLAEAYIKGKLHKEKMKEAEQERQTTEMMSTRTSATGCFFWFSRKSGRISDNYYDKNSAGTTLDANSS